MSEYQCYEFLALDEPLTSKQMAGLRAISSRAEISPTRFWNEYEYGDLKADPVKLVERYFDAHLYFANWGTHRLMLRAPMARIDAKALRAYFVGDATWTLALSPRAKDEWLRRAVDNPELALGAEMARAFRAKAKPAPVTVRRTVAQLLSAAERYREQRERAETARAAKARRAAEAARTKHLDALAKRVDEAWANLELLVARSAYADAVKLAIDLRDLGKRDEASGSFDVRFAAMRKRQLRRRPFFERWRRENEPRQG